MVLVSLLSLLTLYGVLISLSDVLQLYCTGPAQLLLNLFLNISYVSAIVSGISSVSYCSLLAYGNTFHWLLSIELIFFQPSIAGSNRSPTTLLIDIWNKSNMAESL